MLGNSCGNSLILSESSAYGTRWLRVFIVCTVVSGMPTFLSGTHIDALEKLLPKLTLTFFAKFAFLLVLIPIFFSEKICAVCSLSRVNKFLFSFWLYSYVHDSPSWNFNFLKNILDREIEDLSALLLSLKYVFCSLDLHERCWFLGISSSFSFKCLLSKLFLKVILFLLFLNAISFRNLKLL